MMVRLTGIMSTEAHMRFEAFSFDPSESMASLTIELPEKCRDRAILTTRDRPL